MIWLVLAVLVLLLGVALFVCFLFAWREPVRRGEVLDFTPRRGKR